MLRGRVGGEGVPFNLGEACVTRAAIRLATGEIGFSYQLGRDAAKARTAAIIDGLAQMPERQKALESALDSIRSRLADERNMQARRTAATRVNFFTLVRGED
jgi:alpha-D-ribose 1-methylphosphonate 5-triphosphate synthase subunit PhnG